MLKEIEGYPRPAVGFYLHNFSYGGVQQVFLSLAEWFASQGYPTKILVMDEQGPLRHGISSSIEIVPLSKKTMLRGRINALRGFRKEWPLALAPLIMPLTPPNSLRGVESLAENLLQTKPDILFSAKPHFNVMALLARRLAGGTARLVMTQHTTLSQRKTRKRKLRESRLEPLMKFAYSEADTVVGVSSRVSGELVDRLQLQPSRVRTIFNPVVPDDLQTRIDHGLVHPWLVNKAVPVILAAGRMGRVKDYATLVRALGIVRQQVPARLVLFSGATGSRKQTERRRSLMELSRELGLEDSFRLEDFSGDLFANMARADVFAISSLSEGFGNVVAEAMACGCPVVSTDTEGPGEILAGGEYGLLVPLADPEKMAAALLQTLQFPVQSDKLKVRAGCFSVERSGREYEKLVHDLLGLEVPLPVTEYLAAAGW